MGAIKMSRTLDKNDMHVYRNAQIGQLSNTGVHHPQVHERVKRRSSLAVENPNERGTWNAKGACSCFAYFGVAWEEHFILRELQHAHNIGDLTYCMMPAFQAPQVHGDSSAEDAS